MHQDQLGATGLKVSAVSFGAALHGHRDGVIIGTKAGRTARTDYVDIFQLHDIEFAGLPRSGTPTTVIGTTKTCHLESAVAAESTPIDEDLLATVLAATAEVHKVSWHSGRSENN